MTAPQPTLPVEPLADWLRTHHADLSGNGAARTCGVSFDTYKGIVAGTVDDVKLSVADRILTRLGGHLELVYPYDDDHTNGQKGDR